MKFSLNLFTGGIWKNFWQQRLHDCHTILGRLWFGGRWIWSRTIEI